MNPVILDIEIVDDVRLQVIGGDFEQLSLRIGGRHLDRVAAHEGLPASPRAEIHGADAGIADVQGDVVDVHAQLFRADHDQGRVAALADIRGAREEVDFAVHIDLDHGRGRRHRECRSS